MTLKRMLAGSALITLVGVPLALFSSGAGHGSYLFAIVLYPFSALSVHFNHSLQAQYVVLALTQFFVYGLILWTAGRYRRAVFVVLAIVHLAAILSYYYLTGSLFAQPPGVQVEVSPR